jgi:DNA repair exonuclease SbcCD nuclease subunit
MPGIKMKKQIPTAILTGDIHGREDTPTCRTDDYLAAQVEKLEFLCGLAKKYEVPVLDGGDLFNRWKSPPWLLRLFIENLRRLQLFISTPGNHDLPEHSMESLARSSLAVLVAAGAVNIGPRVDVVDLKDGDTAFHAYCVPWGEQPAARPPSMDKPNVLITHTMTWASKKPPYPGAEYEGGPALHLLKKCPGFDLIVTGHNHDSFVVEHEGRLLVNPGSMMRMSAAQEGHKPSLYLWYADEKRVERVLYPAAPGVISREHLDVVQERDERIEAFVRSLREGGELGLSFEENLDRYIATNKGKIRPGVVEIIREVVNASTERVAG